MNPIRPEEILSCEVYEEGREAFRRRVMVRKAKRRVPLGDHATLHFETRETMLYQIHEMLRAENSWQRPGAVEDELEAYNPLVPDGSSLSATLMFEFDDPAERAVRLGELVGIDRHLWLQIGAAEPLRATFDGAQAADGRISSVQYVRWALERAHIPLLRQEGTAVRLGVDHPHYAASAVLAEETRKELAGDLE